MSSNTTFNSKNKFTRPKIKKLPYQKNIIAGIIKSVSFLLILIPFFFSLINALPSAASIAPNYYIYAQAESSNQPDTTIESSIGFIPFNLKLEMDGLSGIKIYNKVKVNTSFLPSNYGETLSFIATGVNHKLSGDEWVTSLDTIATTKSQFTKKK